MRNLEKHLDLEKGSERDLRPTMGGAGMCSALTNAFAKKFGGAIGDLVGFSEAGSAVHEYRHLDDTLHLVQVAKGRLQRGEDFDGDVTRGLPALRRCDLLPQFAGEWLAVFLGESSRQINKIAGSHKRHKRWNVGIDHPRREVQAIDF